MRHRLRFLPIGTLAIVAASCTAPRDARDERLRRSVSARTSTVESIDLTEQSSEEPVTVEAELESGKDIAVSADAPPDALTLALSDLRLHTLRNNLDLAVALQEPGIARTFVDEEEAKFDAVITGAVRYKRTDFPALDSDLVSFTTRNKDLDKEVVKLTEIEQQKERLEYDLGIKLPLPTGGVIGLKNTLEESNKIDPLRFEQYTSALKFSLSQPLLRGAGTDASLASIRIARFKADEVAAKTKLSAIKLLAMAEKVYWKAYAARRMAEVRRQQLDLATQNRDMVARRAEEGLSPEIEVVRADLGVTQRVESLIMAETADRIQQRDLKRILNMEELDLSDPARIDISDEPTLVRYDLAADELVQLAIENRMELLELELALARDAVKIDFARNQQLPYFALEFQYGILDRQGSFGTAWEGMWDTDYEEILVGLSGEIPVTNDAREAKLRRAILTRQQRLFTRDLRELAIRQEVLDALDILNQNWRRILAARRNVIAAGINYDAERKQFDEGLRTMREVLEALTELGNAQLREIKAVVSYQIAQIDLAFATGTLLGYARVNLGPIALTPPKP